MPSCCHSRQLLWGQKESQLLKGAVQKGWWIFGFVFPPNPLTALHEAGWKNADRQQTEGRNAEATAVRVLTTKLLCFYPQLKND